MGLTFQHLAAHHYGMVANETDKIRENRLRRKAKRQGFLLVKSRRRDPYALDFGEFMVVDAFTNTIVYGELNSPRALSLDEVEEWLNLPFEEEK